jgi:tetraprenyl-beta-curcumene synthase
VSREVGHWRRRAESIPDLTLRAQAIDSLERKRPNTDGAALLATLPRVRSDDLVRLLVAYEILGDFLDTTNERGGHLGTFNGLQLNRALHDALDPSIGAVDYYRHHAWTQDGGYVQGLVAMSQAMCLRLPSFATVRPLVAHASCMTVQCQALNHERSPDRRQAGLKAIADTHFAGQTALSWFEWTGAASAWLTSLALVAMAADRDLTSDQAQRVNDAYLPWVSLAATMLDSYSDLAEDAASGTQSFLSLYDHLDEAVARLIEVLRRSIHEAVALDRGHRHLVIVACMIAMYLTKDGPRNPDMHNETLRIAASGGNLTRLLLPAVRGWRVLHALESA